LDRAVADEKLIRVNGSYGDRLKSITVWRNPAGTADDWGRIDKEILYADCDHMEVEMYTPCEEAR
jgi:hypothetical protein